MKKLFSILTPLCFFMSFTLNAQVQPMPICGYDHELKKILEKNPNFLDFQNSIFENAYQKQMLLNNSKRSIVADTEYYEIPLVFHVIYKTSTQNLSSAIIMSQFNALNEDFRKRNADTTGIRSIFKSLAADVKIQFKLAATDPNGNATSGITRTLSAKNTFAISNTGAYSEDMKSTANGGMDAWNPVKYLNIWICNLDFGPGKLGIVYGFAVPPTGAPNWGGNGNFLKDVDDPLSGVVLHYEIVGVNNPLSPAAYKKGNTATHEIGHYLGLRHIWGDGTNPFTGQNNCLQSDGIFDTPFARESNTTCPSNRNTCNEGVDDKPDMTENYMDYALDVCGAMFTKQQAFTMRYVLQNFRTGLPNRKINYDTFPDYSTNQLLVYPNPLKENEKLNIRINSPTSGTFTIKLIDAVGQFIEEKKYKANQLSVMDTNWLANGLYFLILTEENGTVIQKQKLIVGY